MNKSKIRKKLIKARKLNKDYGLTIKLNFILKILKKSKIKKKIIGGYYPYNYEVDAIKVLEKLEQLNFLISLPKIKKTIKWTLCAGQQKILFR